MIPLKLNSKPEILSVEVERFIKSNWTFIDQFQLKELISYDSRTYLVECDEDKCKYIFKVANDVESRDVRYFECISRILRHLQINKINAQIFVQSSNGKFILDLYDNRNERQHPLKSFLLSFIEGDLILNRRVTKEICQQIAKQLNKLTDCVNKISSELNFLIEFAENSIWNIKNALNVRHIIPYFECDHKKDLLNQALNNFELHILPNMGKFTKGFIHGDPNDMNIIINENEEIYFIDWQDSTISYKVYDLAILIFSMISISLNSKDPLEAICIGKSCITGYLTNNHHSLNKTDIDLLTMVVQTRVAMSLSIGYYTNKFLDPSNEYLLHTQKTGWNILEDLLVNQDQYVQQWKIGDNLC